jgi:protein O-mannosyl-transferase
MCHPPFAREASPETFPSCRVGLARQLVAGVSASVLGFGLVRWDDDINLTQNPLLTEPWSWSLAGKLLDAGQALRFKPVHWLVDRAVHGLVGFDPAGWHALNLALHLVATLLFHAVLRRLLARMTSAADGVRADAAAWLGAALRAVHPLRAETVAWATASPYPLTATGGGR